MENYPGESNYLKAKSMTVPLIKEYAQYCAEVYPVEISECCVNSKIYRNNNVSKVNPKLKNTSSVYLVPMDTVSAAIESTKRGEKTVILNFASYKYPGGKFLDGSRAQEESLCRESILYNVLSRFPNYYNENKTKLMNSLYTNAAIYSPNVLFFRPSYNSTEFNRNTLEKYFIDVLTCASPNWRTAKHYASKMANNSTMNSRVCFIFDCLYDFISSRKEVYNNATLILGAFGCGVFEQDPYYVAKIFKDCISVGLANEFSKIVFAIPLGNENFDAFKSVFEYQDEYSNNFNFLK